jgi:hypothetical protein
MMHAPAMHRRSAVPAVIGIVLFLVVAGCAGDPEPDDPSGVPIRDPNVAWQPTPFRLADPVLAGAVAACRGFGKFPAGGQPVLVDARGGGRITVLFVAPNNTTGSCSVAANSSGSFTVRSAGMSSGTLAAPALGPNAIEDGGITTEGGESMNGLTAPAYSTLSGRVGSAVTGVELEVAGRPITATVGNGWFSAWWPTGDAPTRMIAIGADGQPLPSSP